MAEQEQDAKEHNDFLEFLYGVKSDAGSINQKSQELLDRVAVLEVKFRRRRQGGKP